MSLASPIPTNDRHGDDDLPPIKEDQEFASSLEHHSPECDQTLSAEVSGHRASGEFYKKALGACNGREV